MNKFGTRTRTNTNPNGTEANLEPDLDLFSVCFCIEESPSLLRLLGPRLLEGGRLFF